MIQKLIVLLCVLPQMACASYVNSKTDMHPVYSHESRYIAFERDYLDSVGADIVVYDTLTGKSRCVVGDVLGMSHNGDGLYALWGRTGISVVQSSGRVESQVWRQEAGYPATDNDWQAVMTSEWTSPDILRFSTAKNMYENGKWDLWEFSARTGKVAFIKRTSPMDTGETEIGIAEGELQTANDRLYRVAGGKKRLVRLGSAVYPALSPDGRKIVVCALQAGGKEVEAWKKLGEKSVWQNLYIMDSDGARPLRVTSDGGTHPVWHPSGEKLMYVNAQGGISEMRPDGSNKKEIVSSIPTTRGLSWTKDGRGVRVVKREDNIAAWHTVSSAGKLKKTGTGFAVADGWEIVISPSGLHAILLSAEKRLGKARLISSGTGETIEWEFEFGSEAGYPTAAFSYDEQEIAVTMAGALFILDRQTRDKKQVTGWIF